MIAARSARLRPAQPPSPMKRYLLKALAAALSIGLAQAAWSANPLIQTIYSADPAPLVHDGRVYLYVGHDEGDKKFFDMRDWRVFSSVDMVNWTDHGARLSLADFSWAKKHAWAGHTIERDGKFYWYVPVEQANGAMAIGVAVGPTPLGPFKDALGKPLVFDKQGDIDPAAYIDDDGQAYLCLGQPDLQMGQAEPRHGLLRHHGGRPRHLPPRDDGRGLRQARQARPRHRLRRSALDLQARQALLPVPCLRPAARAPGLQHWPHRDGPWTYGGVVMKTQGGSFTNHPGVIDYKGKTYLFYHDGSLPGGGGFSRSVCVEELVRRRWRRHPCGHDARRPGTSGPPQPLCALRARPWPGPSGCKPRSSPVALLSPM